MRKYTFSNGLGIYARISKASARSAYMAGITVIMAPCNIRPFCGWGMEYTLNRESRAAFVIDDIGAENDFDNLVSSYEYYKCTSRQTGRYASFYILVPSEGVTP